MMNDNSSNTLKRQLEQEGTSTSSSVALYFPITGESSSALQIPQIKLSAFSEGEACWARLSPHSRYPSEPRRSLFVLRNSPHRRKRFNSLLFRSPPKKSVRFANDPQIITVNYDEKDLANAWYNAKERTALLEKRRHTLETLQWQEPFAAADPTSWTSTFRGIHKASQTRNGRIKVEQILGSLPWRPDPCELVMVLGMERTLLFGPTHNTQRKAFYESVMLAQTTTATLPAAGRIRAICQASVMHSRSANVYAQCVAALLLEAEEKVVGGR